MTEPRLSYTGQRVYVGIDVHKATYAVTCVCQRRIVKSATVPADPGRLAESLPRWFPGATLLSAYEAGFSGFVLHRVLAAAGITNIVVNPASVAVAANDRARPIAATPRNWLLTWRTGAYVASLSLRKPRSWHGSSRAPAHRLSSTAPPLPARLKPNSTSLA